MWNSHKRAVTLATTFLVLALVCEAGRRGWLPW